MAQQDLLSDKKLGFALEIVLIKAISGQTNYPTTVTELLAFVSNHKELHKAVYMARQDQTMMKIMLQFVKESMESTNSKLNEKIYNSNYNFRYLLGNKVLSSVDGGTGAFDLETDKANLHVKLNQSDKNNRIIGFQKDSIKKGSVVPGTTFGNVYFNTTNSVMKSLKGDVIRKIAERLKNKDLKKAEMAYEMYTNKQTGMPKKPGNLHGTPDSKHPFVLTKQAIKEVYKEKGFDRIFTNNAQKFADTIAEDIRNRVFTPFEEKEKIIGFAKYTCQRDGNGYPINVDLALDVYSLLNKEKKEREIWVNFFNGSGTKQPYGVVWLDQDEHTDDNALFFIEFRTDGEGHPPQLKIGNPAKLNQMLKYKKIA